MSFSRTKKTKAEKDYVQYHNWKDEERKENPEGSKDRLRDVLNIFHSEARKDI